MPRKPKFTREEIAAQALAIIKEEGLAALTARGLGARLGASARPIFTVFQSMEEVKLAARAQAIGEFMEYVSDFRDYVPAFKRLGMKVVAYSIHEPEMFKLLFMREHPANGVRGSLADLGELVQEVTEMIRRDYGMSEAEAGLLFEQLWTQTFGMGAMCAMGISDLSEEEIGRRLAMCFAGHVMLIRAGKLDTIYSDVAPNTDGTFHGHPIQALP